MTKNPTVRRRSKVGLYVCLILATVFAVYFYRSCSLRLFPESPARLAEQLSADFGVTLPSSARVLDAERLAYRDSAYYFRVELVPAEMPAWIERLKQAVLARGFAVQDRDHSEITTIGGSLPRPTWWGLAALPGDALGLELMGPSGTGYKLVYSLSTGMLWVEYFTT